MDYIITIDQFTGPLDLLLHLIKQSNISIYDIKIKDITDQYLEYIKKMSELNLNIASSYLVMAAELIEMKTSMLLPKPEVSEDEYEENTKDKLIQRLIEYQQYKEMKSAFQELEQSRKEYFTKEPTDLSDMKSNPKLPEDIDLDDLIKAFSNFLNRQEKEKPLNTKIATKEYSITARSKEIKDLLQQRKQVNFVELFEIKSKAYIVVTFLSILVLAKNKELQIKQENNFEDILLCEVLA